MQYAVFPLNYALYVFKLFCCRALEHEKEMGIAAVTLAILALHATSVLLTFT